jgi:type IV pilus assembly protein PilN
MIKINLLPDTKPVKKRRVAAAYGGAGRLNLMLVAGGLAVGLLVILVHYLVLSSQIKDLDEKIRKDQLEVARLESVLREVKDFEDKKTRLQKKVDLINQLKLNQKGPVRLMDEVSNALPDLVWIDSMEYRGNSINVSGKAFNPPAISNFITNLKKVPAFQEPNLQDLRATSAGGAQLYNYRLSFIFSNLDRTQGEPPPPPPAAGSAPASPSPKADLARPAATVPTAETVAAVPAAAGM